MRKSEKAGSNNTLEKEIVRERARKQKKESGERVNVIGIEQEKDEPNSFRAKKIRSQSREAKHQFITTPSNTV